ncbi:hypothetical protein ABZ897_20250 [Nonomuraea sp. NPDC046802]|uniref:hypothetical protein n=1 Tax=Nonomuraea sp. NPDC046802 TaxID=3154919 RepID=UPI0033F0D07F
MTTLGDDVEALRTTYPGWSIFCSDEGVFYATRRGVRLREADIHRGLHQTVCTYDLATLAQLLQRQDRLTVR